MCTIKTKKELMLIKKACRITDQIYLRIISGLNKHKFRTEKDLAEFINSEIAQRKLKPSFPCIVAAGPGASEPHHTPENRRLKGFVVIDFGVVYKKYMSDMTRTVYVGKPSAGERKIYGLLLKSQITAVNRIKAGMKCRDAHLSASKVLGKWDKRFIHGLGHGIGTKIHEMPRVRKKSWRYIREGMAITVEPGIYVKNKFGIRIEDTCEIRHGKCMVLTKSGKKLTVIGPA